MRSNRLRFLMSVASVGMVAVAVCAYRWATDVSADEPPKIDITIGGRWTSPPLPPEAAKAQDAYRKELLAALKDPTIDGPTRNEVLKQLARLDDVTAYERYAETEKNEISDAWVRAVAVSPLMPMRLLQKGEPKVRLLGVWLAIIRQDKDDLRIALESERDPRVRGQILMGLAETRDVKMLGEVARVAGDMTAPEVERRAARMGLSAFLGGYEELTPAQFKEEAAKLGNMVAEAGTARPKGPDTRPDAP